MNRLVQRSLLVAIVVLGAALPAVAQFTGIIGNGIYLSSASAGFTGIGDAVSGAKLHFGLIAYSSANKTPTLINLCDNAGANCGDVAAVNGIVSSTQVVNGNTCTNHSGAHPCLIHTLYDDSGANNCSSAACNLVQATASFMPFFEPSCKGSVPCVYCDSSATLSMQTAATWGGFGGPGVGFTLIGGVSPTVTQTSNARVISSITSNTQIGINSSNDPYIYAGTALSIGGTAMTNGTFYSEIGVSDTSNKGTIYLNGSGNTATAIGTSASGNTVSICGDPGAGGGVLNAQIMEGAIYTSALSSGQVSSVTTNMRANGGY